MFTCGGSARRPCSPWTASGTTTPSSRSSRCARSSESTRTATVRTFRLIGAGSRRAHGCRERARRQGRRRVRARSCVRSSAADDHDPAEAATTTDGRRRQLTAVRARSRAYVAALQRDLNRHLIELGSPTASGGRRPVGQGHRSGVHARVQGARHRGQAQRAHVPGDRGRGGAAQRSGARARGQRMASSTRPSCATTSRTPRRRAAKPKPEPAAFVVGGRAARGGCALAGRRSPASASATACRPRWCAR